MPCCDELSRQLDDGGSEVTVLRTALRPLTPLLAATGQAQVGDRVVVVGDGKRRRVYRPLPVEAPTDPPSYELEVLSDGWHGGSFVARYCPFCGRKVEWARP